MSGAGLAYADRVQETSATTGTGTLTLAGAVTGYRSFTSAFVNTQTVYYTISDGTNWEVGKGIFTSAGPSLTRDQVFASSNSGSLVNFTGSKNVWCDLPAGTFADRGLAVAMAMGLFAQ